MYDAEQKLVEMLPLLAQECLNAEARDAFMLHEQETRQQIRNLEWRFQSFGSQPSMMENHTIAGLKRDHDTFLQQRPPREALTLFNLHVGYKSEYIEIAAYHNLIDAANSLGLQQCVQAFQQNLQQEMEAAKKLGTIAHQFSVQRGQAAQIPASSAPMGNQPNAANPQMPGQNQPSTAKPTKFSASQVQGGMEVVGSDLKSVGSVKDVRENDFLVAIPMQRDIYVPFTGIQNVDEGRIVLNIPASQVYKMNWPKPSIT